jgi:hypothetical protein
MSAETSSNNGELVYDIYEKSHISFLVVFLGIYLFYIGVSSIIKSTAPGVTDAQLHTAFDIGVLVSLVGYCIYVFNDFTSLQKNNVLQIFWNWCLDFYSDDVMILAAIVFMVAFYFIVFCFKITLHNSPYVLYILESKAWIFLVTLLFFYILKKAFHLDVIRYLYLTDDNVSIFDTRFKYWGEKVVRDPSEVAEISSEDETTPDKPQVFNVSNNLYTYDDAQYICKSLNGRLATYDEVEDAYKNGGEWCNYGWTEGQLALFPTQKSTWDLLQTSGKMKNSCGRPGINGGYVKNPHQKYGVNCFGVKPLEKETDIKPASYMIPSEDGTPSQNDVDAQKKLEFWKKYGNDILQLNSFNRTSWYE